MPGPSSGAHQVLVYSGPGVSAVSLSHTLLTLSLLLLPHYTVQPITPAELSAQPWEPACALLVIPGGRDLPYVAELTSKTKVTPRIKEYVREGGRYLGICAGAYFGSQEIKFDVGGYLNIAGERDLDFFPGVCTGPTFPGFTYAKESGARAVSLILETPGSESKRTIDNIYYNGGGHFILPSPLPSGLSVIASYPASEHQDEPVAAVLASYGKGKALLNSVHFEYPLDVPPAKDAIKKLKTVPSQEIIEQSEKSRVDWAGELLELLGLKLPGRTGNSASLGAHSDEDPDLLLHPTHPSPIFVLSHPSLPQLGQNVFDPSAIKAKLTAEETGEQVLRDGNDELHISDIAHIPAVGPSPTSDDITAHLAKRRRTKPVFPPPLTDLSINRSSAEPSQPPDFNSLPKSILLPSPDLPYTPRWTPLFNFETYWAALDEARKRSGRKSGVMRKDADGGDKTSLGDLVWYAETVTSTQTMLDRNPVLLNHLPSPLAFLASFQLTGRGRGSNIWLSPPGCLQFSLLLTLPQALSSKLVFIQYLMALAVCEAVDDDGRLGVRIKWPNDIYAEVEGVGDSEVGSGKKGRAKLGGILVNTNFVGGQWRIVVGCGINVLNALPTTSLSQLQSLITTRTLVNTGKPSPAPPTMEGTFAKIMASFEQKWDQFIEEKGFSGFLDEYYGRWLHTNQEVTLTTTTPHTPLRIHSITTDHGLLRCVPRQTAGLTPLYNRGDFGGDDRTASRTQKEEEKYVDLQPDGNSFDLMSGLIKRKT